MPEPEVEFVQEDYEAHTIAELIAAGSDMAEISASISNLTNEIHPFFRDENMCVCKHLDDLHCHAPYFAANPDALADKKKAPVIVSPYAAKSILVREILRLASKFLTHDDTLPFWAGILDCARGPRQHVARFHVHPRKHLSKARKADTLEELSKFADQIRLHFKEFDPEGDYKNTDAYAICWPVDEDEPDYDLATGAFPTCYHRIPECDCYTGPVYAYRHGKPVIEASRFQHIFMNTRFIPGFDQSSDQWRGTTICKA